MRIWVTSKVGPTATHDSISGIHVVEERPMNASESILKLPEYPGSVRAWLVVVVSCFAAMVSYTDRLILGSLVDPLKHALGVSDAEVSLLQGIAFALVYVFAGLYLGRLADRKRRLTILIAGSILWCIGTVLCGLAPSFWTLFLARVVVGIGEAALAPAAISMIADCFPPFRRGTAIGIFMLGYAVGGPASITIGGVVLSAANAGAFQDLPAIGFLQPWRAALVLVGLGGLVVPILFMTLQEPLRQHAAPVVPVRAMIRRLATDRISLVPAYVAVALLAVGDYGTLTWMPSLLSRRFAMPPAEVGHVFGAITSVAAILGSVLGGLGSDAAGRRHGIQGRLLLGLGAAALASVGAALISSAQAHTSLTGLGLWTLCSVIGAVTGVAVVQSLVPNEFRGVSMALLTFCTTLLGLGLGPTFVALITEQVYRNDASVGFAITATALPSGGLAGMFFLYSSRTVAVSKLARE